MFFFVRALSPFNSSYMCLFLRLSFEVSFPTEFGFCFLTSEQRVALGGAPLFARWISLLCHALWYDDFLYSPKLLSR
jgi:hypothetical protein